MKLRYSFVANSSTSSFIILVPKKEDATITLNNDSTLYSFNSINLNTIYNLDNIEERYLKLNWTPKRISNIMTETKRYVRLTNIESSFSKPRKKLDEFAKIKYDFETEFQKFIIDIIERTLFYYNKSCVSESHLKDFIYDLKPLLIHNRNIIDYINSFLNIPFDMAFHESFEKYYYILSKYKEDDRIRYLFNTDNMQYRTSIKRKVLRNYYFEFKCEMQRYITILGIYGYMYRFKYKLQKLSIPYGGDDPSEMDTFIRLILLYENEYPSNIKNFYILKF